MANGHTGAALSADQVEEARLFWEESEETAAAIGLRLSVSRNTIVGLAYRRRWLPRGQAGGYPTPTTLFQRMDALDARLDEVLRQNPPGKEATSATTAPALRLISGTSCSSRSSRPSRLAKAPGSASRSASTS